MDRGDANWLARQPEDARKEFSALVAMRWATCVQEGVAAAYMLWLINKRVNRHLFSLSDHPDLCFRLLASCGLQEHALRREWLKGPGNRVDNNAALSLLAEHHPMSNEMELRILLSQYSKQSFSEFVADCGIERDQAKKCMDAYAKLSRG